MYGFRRCIDYFSAVLLSEQQHEPCFEEAHCFECGQPMHFSPFIFALTMYITAHPIIITRIAVIIIFANIKSPLFNYFFAAYSALSSLFVFAISAQIITTNATIAISPPTKPAPKAPVVISVPI